MNTNTISTTNNNTLFYAIKNLSERNKTNIMRNIAYFYCLIDKKSNTFSAKLTNKSYVHSGQFLIKAKEARNILISTGFTL